ncbi:MAG: hypothetical protein ABI629_15120 [bacterium]
MTAAVWLAGAFSLAAAEVPPPSAPATDPTTGAVVAAVTVVLAIFFGLLVFVMYRERRARLRRQPQIDVTDALRRP